MSVKNELVPQGAVPHLVNQAGRKIFPREKIKDLLKEGALGLAAVALAACSSSPVWSGARESGELNTPTPVVTRLPENYTPERVINSFLLEIKKSENPQVDGNVAEFLDNFNQEGTNLRIGESFEYRVSGIPVEVIGGGTPQPQNKLEEASFAVFTTNAKVEGLEGGVFGIYYNPSKGVTELALSGVSLESKIDGTYSIAAVRLPQEQAERVMGGEITVEEFNDFIANNPNSILYRWQLNEGEKPEDFVGRLREISKIVKNQPEEAEKQLREVFGEFVYGFEYVDPKNPNKSIVVPFGVFLKTHGVNLVNLLNGLGVREAEAAELPLTETPTPTSSPTPTPTPTEAPTPTPTPEPTPTPTEGGRVIETKGEYLYLGDPNEYKVSLPPSASYTPGEVAPREVFPVKPVEMLSAVPFVIVSEPYSATMHTEHNGISYDFTIWLVDLAMPVRDESGVPQKDAQGRYLWQKAPIIVWKDGQNGEMVRNFFRYTETKEPRVSYDDFFSSLSGQVISTIDPEDIKKERSPEEYPRLREQVLQLFQPGDVAVLELWLKWSFLDEYPMEEFPGSDPLKRAIAYFHAFSKPDGFGSNIRIITDQCAITEMEEVMYQGKPTMMEKWKFLNCPGQVKTEQGELPILGSTLRVAFIRR